MYEIVNEYSNFREMEFTRTSTSKAVVSMANDLVGQMGKRKSSDYKINMKVLLLELYVTYLEDHEQYLGYNRHRNFYSDRRKEDGCDNPLVTADYMLGCISFLISEQYVSHKVGGRFTSESVPDIYYKYLSKIRPTDALIKLWSDYKWQPHMVASLVKNDLIRLKSVTEKIENKFGPDTKVNHPIKYKPNKISKQMYQVVSDYNARLKNYRIECDLSRMSEEHKKEIERKMLFKKQQWLGRKRNAGRDPGEYNPKIVIKLSKTSTYRVFNNADTQFRYGGRFYYAWWTSCPSVVRRYITIDDSPTVELDYSGMHIHLLYALKGINYDARREDPYILDGSTDKTDRKINKFILLTALNANGDTNAIHAVNAKRHNNLEMHGLIAKNPIVTIGKKLEKLKLKHPAIANDITKGVGLILQNHDSRIIESLIIFCLKENIPVLTVHDSVIVQARYANFIRNVMTKMFVDHISRYTDTKADYSKYIHSSDVFIYLNRHTKNTIVKNIIYTNSMYELKAITKESISSFLDIKPVIKVDSKAIPTDKVTRVNTKGTKVNTIKLSLDESGALKIDQN